MRNSAPRSTLVLGSLVAGTVCGSLLGFLLGSLSSNPASQLGEPPAVQGRDPELVRVLSRLENHLDRLEISPLRPVPATQDSPREPIPTQSFEELPQLVEVLDRLNATLMRMESSPTGSTAGRLSGIAAQAPVPMDSQDMALLLSPDRFADFARALRFQSYADVLTRFGHPKYMSTTGSGGQDWLYVPSDDPTSLGFRVRFHDGFVFTVEGM